MRSLRDGGTVTFSTQAALRPFGIHVASRSSWFVPVVGIFIYIFSTIDATIEGCNLALFVNSCVGLALVCYRLWPSIAFRRVIFMLFLTGLESAVLVAQILTFAVDLSWLRTWFGDRNIAGLVLDTLSLITLCLIAWDRIPQTLHNPSKIPFWRVPLGYQMLLFLVSCSGGVLFNPSLFISPYLLVLVWSLYELSSGTKIDQCLISKKVFPRFFLVYTSTYSIVSFILAFPDIRQSVRSVDWLAPLLGVPMMNDSEYNYACLMPSAISLFCGFVMAPWWVEVGHVSRTGRSRLYRTSTRGSQAEAPHSPHRSRRMASAVSSIAQGSEEGVIVQEALRLVEEKRVAAEKRDRLLKKLLKLFQVIVVGLLLPLALVCIPLLLPSTLTIPLIVLGIVLMGNPKLFALTGFGLEIYLIIFFVGVYVSSVMVDSLAVSSSTLSTLFGVGLLGRNNEVWDRFLLLSALIGLLVTTSMVNRLKALNMLPGQSFLRQAQSPLGLVDEDLASAPPSRWELVKQSVVGVVRSAELGFALVVTIVFTTAAIEVQSSCISVLYIVITIPTLWAPEQTNRTFLSIGLMALAAVVISIFVAYASWVPEGDSPTLWLNDIGFSSPKPSNCFVYCLPHLLIALCGSLYLRLRNMSTEAAKDRVGSLLNLYPLFTARLGLFVPMVLSLVLFVMMPFDYFSAIVIVCFVVQMALLQEGIGHDFSIDSVILRVNVLQLLVLVITLIWVMIAMIPIVYEQVAAGLQFNKYISASELAVEPNCGYLGKLCVVAALLLSCSVLVKYRSFIERSTEKMPQDVARWQKEYPVWCRILAVISSQMTRMLIFIIFLASVYQTTLLNVASELIVCCFLIVGHGWSQVGFVFSIVSMVLLFLQYLSSFSVVCNLADPSLLEYLGLFWSGGAVARNLTIFLACILQRNVQQFVKIHFGGNSDPYFDGLDRSSQVAIGTVLILAATGRGNFFSVVYLVIGTAFVIRQMMTSSRLSIWALRFVAIVVGLCVATQQLIRLWFPTVCDWCKERPDLSSLCRSDLNSTDTIACIDDWQRYFNVPSSSHGDTVLTLDTGVLNTIAAQIGFRTPYSVPSMHASGIILDFIVLWTVCVLIQNHVLRSQRTSSRSVSVESEGGKPRSSRRRRVISAIGFFLARFWIVVVEIFSILSCFSWRSTVDCISICFLIFTFVLAWAQEKSLTTRRRAVVAGLVIGLVVVGISIAYQVPVFACKYWTVDTDIFDSGPVASSTEWSIPTIMCVDVQRRMKGSENWGAFKWSQIAIQVIGLMKFDVRFGSIPFPMTIGPCIVLVAALLIQLALYDHSRTYHRVNMIHFEKEFRLRKVRARRFVSEFNANLFVRNRQVSQALAATKRKLVRVQKSAEVLLGLFYSRLAGTASGELVRSQTDHLSTEAETVCARGYSPEEADLAVALSRDQPDGTALLMLETASEFALNGCQESEVVVRCRSLLEIDEPTNEKIKWYRQVLFWLSDLNDTICSWLSYRIDDVVFVSDVNGAEPLSLHRRNDGILLLFAKALFTNSLIFVVGFSVLAFVSTNSVFDVVRVGIVLGSLPVWPFANRNLWRCLLIYTCVGMAIKTIYQLPLFCGVGIDGNKSFSAPLWRMQDAAKISAASNYIKPCQLPSILGWDIVAGIPKMFGSGALDSLRGMNILNVVWQDVLVLLSLLWYRSFLHKAGIWEYLQVASLERDSGAIVVPRKERKPIGILISEESAFDVAAADEPVELGDIEDFGTGGGLDGLGEEQTGEESPVGSFVDLNCHELDSTDRELMSKYSVQRHMGCEDVFGRLTIESRRCSNFQFSTGTILAIIEIYKRVRWEAQYAYANHACVRIPREERETINTVTASGLSLLPKISALYVKINPFYAAKVGKDYYVYFFVIGLMMFFHVIVFYSKMTGTQSADFFSSIQRSQFSGGLALLMLFHFVLLIFDRAYYIASFRRSSNERKASSVRIGFRPPPKQQVFWFFLRLVILVTLTVTLHAVVMNSLFTRFNSVTSYSPLIQNAALAVYYIECMLYLVIAGLQIKEGFPRLMKESLRPDKTYHTVRDKFQEIRFLVYRAIPFLDELRVLIDWTVSRSCLDLFQYFKLEDAHTYLWQTGRDMEIRKKMWPAEAIGKAEKGFMGLGFLILLMVIIIGPVLLFSTLVSQGVVAPLAEASFSVSLVVQTCPSCTTWVEGAPITTSTMQLYSATPSSFNTVAQNDQAVYFPEGRMDIDKDSTVQQTVFEKQSEIALVTNSERYKSFHLATSQAVYINIEASLTFKRETDTGGYVGPPTTIRMPSCACKVGFEHLCQLCTSIPSNETAIAFASMFEAANALIDPVNTDLILVPGALAGVIKTDASGTAIDTSLKQNGDFRNNSMALSIIDNIGYVAAWDVKKYSCDITYTGVCRSADETQVNSLGGDPVFAFIMAPVYATDGTGGALLSIGIVTVYITIVYAIGRFLRLVFDKESLRVIYLEIPRPDDLVDLATGAAIARHYKDLPMEFKLYNCLIKIMRSPETLIALGGADLTGYGARRNDDPPYPELLCDEDRERIRRRRRKNRNKK